MLFRSGVQIDLIVRGICTLRPGVKGMSENIRVTSIIGRYLEHSRIFYFENGGKEETFCGSADWMPRNLFERCEVVFPIKDVQICQRIRNEILAAYLADTAKARWLDADGIYHRVRDTGKRPEVFSSQDFFMQLAEGKAANEDIPHAEHVRKEAVNHHQAEKDAKKATPVKRKSAAD